ncbi:MAG: MFS transporter [Ilumatobacteraceae bacterium]
MSFNTTATNLAFDDISASFPSASPTTISWVGSIFFIGLASLLPISGRLADRVGRRRVFRWGLTLFAVGAMLSAVAWAPTVLMAARLISSAGGAFVVPSSLAVILPEFPRARHTLAVGLWSATGPVAASLTPPVSALILSVFNWRVLFALSAPVALIALAGSYRVLDESRSERPGERLDWLGVAIGTAVIAGLIFAVGQGSSVGWLAPPVLAASFVVFTGFPVFLRRCRRHPEPMLNLDIFLLRPVWVANLGGFLMNLGANAMWLVWPLYMARVWHYDKGQIGLALLPAPIMSAAVTLIGSRISERHGHEVLARWGPCISLLAPVWPLMFIGAEPNYWLAMFPAIAFTGAGWALVIPPLNTGLISRVGSDHYAEVNATYNAVHNVAAALGLALTIAVLGDPQRLDAIDAYNHVFWMCIVSGLACWLVLFFMYPTQRRTREAKDPS